MRALLIEDDLTIAKYIINGLKEASFSVKHAIDGSSGLNYAICETFDIGIFDIMLPGISGLEVIEKLRHKKMNIPVLILSARQSIDDRVRGLQCGGDDYLIKPFSFSELLARVHALIRRSTQVVESSTLTVGDLQIDLLSRKVVRAGKRIDLQPKEFSLLEYLVRNQGHVVSKTMITERVWDYHFDPQTNVVEARISKLRDKVDRGFEIQLIHTVRGIGYVLQIEDI